MSTLDVHNKAGEVLHEKVLADAFTEAEVNAPVIHQCGRCLPCQSAARQRLSEKPEVK